MIEDAKSEACKAKKVDRGGVRTSNSGQSTARTSSNINHRTFPKLLDLILKNIGKIKLKMGLKQSIFCRILPAFAAALRSLKQKISCALFSHNHKSGLKNQSSGYILILILTFIPIILLGTKLVLDQRTMNEAKLENGTVENDSNSARKISKIVAKNWNPGLTFNQQKEAVYKVADAVYNYGTVYESSVKHQAISGLEKKHLQKSKQQGGMFVPIKDPSRKQRGIQNIQS